VSPEQWNAIVEQIEYLEDAVAVYKSKWEVATGQDEFVELTPEVLAEWLSDDLQG